MHKRKIETEEDTMQLEKDRDRRRYTQRKTETEEDTYRKDRDRRRYIQLEKDRDRRRNIQKKINTEEDANTDGQRQTNRDFMLDLKT